MERKNRFLHWAVPAFAVAVPTVAFLVAVPVFDFHPLEWPWLELWSVSVGDIERFVERWGAWSALGSIVLMVLHSFLPLPAELIAIANGMLFGSAMGVGITWIGAMIGAGCAFAIARHCGRPLVHRVVAKRHWQAIASWQVSPSTLVFVRLIPVISFNLVNYAAGLAGVSWLTFLWTTGFGILPITVVSVVLGDRLLALPWPVWLVVGFGVIGSWWVFSLAGSQRWKLPLRLLGRTIGFGSAPDRRHE
jgi:uncharacterized membrane protein YdjX (TVP38/TMEM64 family)